MIVGSIHFKATNCPKHTFPQIKELFEPTCLMDKNLPPEMGIVGSSSYCAIPKTSRAIGKTFLAYIGVGALKIRR